MSFSIIAPEAVAARRQGMTTDYETFSAEELEACLSHYDLGTIGNTQAFTRGSARSPKVLIDSQRGRFLLKRRAKGKDNPRKVAFTHQIQLYLFGQNFPLPQLVTTRDENNSMVVLNSNIYELFEFVEGDGYDSSPEATFHAGQILGQYHKLLKDFRSDFAPPTGSYHDASTIPQAIRRTVRFLPMASRPPAKVIRKTTSSLEQAYKSCAAQADALGLGGWDVQIVHGDWHPGNMLFRDKRVAAVVDYDAACLQQRVIDLANGALQFSIIGGGEDPAGWPDHPDEARFKRFVCGYDSISAVSATELKAIPFLMCEAMIAEGVLPIATTGSFGRIEGFPFLQTIDRKVKWILGHLEQLQAVVGK